jgi:hypothetical protein
MSRHSNSNALSWNLMDKFARNFKKNLNWVQQVVAQINDLIWIQSILVEGDLLGDKS